ncbi:MAG TPA: DUF370 domain-containing protein [Candidatus Coprocola pullicola]|nr:DUF370 domain-containing protein [Candidatus Coprocola pullicola]
MEGIQFLNIGYGNMVSAQRIIAMLNPDSAPIKRIMQEAKEKGMLIDATYGRKTRSVIMMDTGQIVLSPNVPVTIGGRLDIAKQTEKTLAEGKGRQG